MRAGPWQACREGMPPRRRPDGRRSILDALAGGGRHDPGLSAGGADLGRRGRAPGQIRPQRGRPDQEPERAHGRGPAAAGAIEPDPGRRGGGVRRHRRCPQRRDHPGDPGGFGGSGHIPGRARPARRRDAAPVGGAQGAGEARRRVRRRRRRDGRPRRRLPGAGGRHRARRRHHPGKQRLHRERGVAHRRALWRGQAPGRRDVRDAGGGVERALSRLVAQTGEATALAVATGAATCSARSRPRWPAPRKSRRFNAICGSWISHRKSDRRAGGGRAGRERRLRPAADPVVDVLGRPGSGANTRAAADDHHGHPVARSRADVPAQGHRQTAGGDP